MSGASLVIQTSFLGDTVLTTPLIAELGARGPVDVVVTPASAGLLANNPCIRKLFVYDKRGRDSGAGGFLGMARAIDRFYGDATGWGGSAPEERTAYLAQGSVRSAMLARLAGFRTRVGFETSSARALYTVRVPYGLAAPHTRAGFDATPAQGRYKVRIPYPPAVHHAERLWRLAFPDAGVPRGEMPPPRLYPGEPERTAVDKLLGARTDRRPLVVLAPGSVWGTKRWPYYPELAGRIAHRYRLAVVGSAADCEAARLIMDAAGAQGVVDATGKLSLLASAELIGRSNLLVTNDSSPQHLASAMATPTITIFGPTIPAFGFGPLAPHSTTIGHPSLPCRPCHHHGPPECPLGHWKCMRELEVGVVERAVVERAERKQGTGYGGGATGTTPWG